MRVLVTGTTGQLGGDIQSIAAHYPDFEFAFTDIHNLNITSKPDLESFFKNFKPEVFINCAAYTAVDKAETETDLAYKVNCEAVEYISELCFQYNTRLIHVSTDYVYDGLKNTPYKETDDANPVDHYAKSKYQGEQAILKQLNNAIIIRTSWLYSTHGHNFLKTMLRFGKERNQLNVVYDQVGTPTFALDLAYAILDMIPQLKEQKNSEIYHFSNEGAVSWFDFAKAIMEMAKLSCRINPIESHQYPTPVKRPHYSVLSKDKIKTDFNVRVPYWKDSLAKALEIINNS